MLKHARARANSESGFTLVELLVVMLILGILASIAIVAFISQRDKASDTGAKTMARTMQTTEEACNVEKGGTYVGCDLTTLQGIEKSIQSNGGTQPQPVGNLGQKTYTVSVKSSTNTTFTIERQTSGTVVRSCDAPNKGACQQVGSNTTTGTW